MKKSKKLLALLLIVSMLLTMVPAFVVSIGATSSTGDDDGITITTDKTFYKVGESIKATVSGTLGSTTDWVGLLPKGAEATIYWYYLKDEYLGVEFDLNAYYKAEKGTDIPAGDYSLIFVANNGYATAATTFADFTVDADGISIELNKTGFKPGESVNVTVNGTLGSETDWVGILPYGADTSVYWYYMTDEYLGKTYDFNAYYKASKGSDLPAGKYSVIFVANSGYAAQATSSVDFIVWPTEETEDDGIVVVADKTEYTVGESIMLEIQGTLQTETDWAALVPEGSAESPFFYTLNKWYVNAQFDLNAFYNTYNGTDLPAGKYRFGWISAGKDISAMSSWVEFTVKAAEDEPSDDDEPAEEEPPVLATDKDVYLEGESIFVTAYGSAANKDWIGIQPKGDSGNSIYWYYITAENNGKPVDIRTGEKSNRPSEEDYNLPAGEYVVYLVPNNGYASAKTETIEITITKNVAPSKRVYEEGESVWVYGTGSAENKDWIGIQPKGDSGNSIYWYYITAENNGKPVDIKTGEKSNRPSAEDYNLPAGSYIVYYVPNNGYASSKTESVEITIVEKEEAATELTLAEGDKPAAYLQMTEADAQGKQKIRAIVCVSEEYLDEITDITMTLKFTMTDTTTRTATVTMSQIKAYTSVYAADQLYAAAEGCVLFGVVIINVPADGWTGISLSTTVEGTQAAVDAYTVSGSLES